MITEYIKALRAYMQKDYRKCTGKKAVFFPYGFLTPGSASYSDTLWDWDSYFSNVALKQILADVGADPQEARDYERGCVLNFLSFTDNDGYMPISVLRGRDRLLCVRPMSTKKICTKPILAQHAAFLVRYDGDAEWLRGEFHKLQYHINNYMVHHKHKPSGLYYWQTDKMIGVDNDPCTFYRPDGSSASIYLNCLDGQRAGGHELSL